MGGQHTLILPHGWMPRFGARGRASPDLRPPHGTRILAFSSMPRKHFSEQQGLAHVLALSEQAVQKKDLQFQKSLEKNQAAREHIAERRKQQQQRKELARQAKDTPSRSSMLKLLREKRRERTRERRKKRKEEAMGSDPAAASSQPTQAPPEGARPKKKRVSFG